jgi:hypothetical protein
MELIHIIILILIYIYYNFEITFKILICYICFKFNIFKINNPFIILFKKLSLINLPLINLPLINLPLINLPLINLPLINLPLINLFLQNYNYLNIQFHYYIKIIILLPLIYLYDILLKYLLKLFLNKINNNKIIKIKQLNTEKDINIFLDNLKKIK